MKKTNWLKNNLVKGAVTFLLQEIDILSSAQIYTALYDIFNYKIKAEDLFKVIKHLQDRNIISIIYGNHFHIRKANYSDLEVAQVRNIVTTNEILINKFKKWKEKLK